MSTKPPPRPANDSSLTPNRRRFLALVGVGSAALVIRKTLRLPGDPPRSPWAGKTRWIGHF